MVDETDVDVSNDCGLSVTHDGPNRSGLILSGLNGHIPGVLNPSRCISKLLNLRYSKYMHF